MPLLVALLLLYGLVFGTVGYFIGLKSASKPIIKEEKDPMELFCDLMVESAQYWDTNPMRAMELHRMAENVLVMAKQQRGISTEPIETTSH